jgi:hypothetical protein
MTRTRSLTVVSLLVIACGVLSACNEEQRPVPPVSSDIANAIAELYQRSGVAEVSKQEILGKHYRPGDQSWDVLACIEFAQPGRDPGKDCNDSFELYQLDTGKWIVSGTVNGAYQWLEVLEG